MKHPHKKNKPLDATITALSHDGRGITHINGKTVFIEGALQDEQISFTYTNQRSRFDEGRVHTLHTTSPARVTPRCPHVSVCGGCQVQHMDINAQRAFKESMLLEQLQHFGKITPQSILSPLTGSIWGYRRKARLGVIVKNGVILGFRDVDGEALVNITRCDILEPRVGEKIEALRAVIASLESPHAITHIEVAIGDTETALVFRHVRALSVSDQQRLITFANTHAMQLYLQPGDVKTVHCIAPVSPAPLTYALPDHAIEIAFQPTDFIQIHAEMNRSMVNRVIELLALDTSDQVLDLFCGLGNFTLPLARYCHSVVGIEVDPDMLARARQNAGHNQIENASFYCADLSQPMPASAWAQARYTKMLLDPPRAGAQALVKSLPKRSADRIVYVSCNPATLARDAGELALRGYRMAAVGIMDMFPHTRHIESIAVFER